MEEHATYTHIHTKSYISSDNGAALSTMLCAVKMKTVLRIRLRWVKYIAYQTLID